jgi:hypothetical protein
MKDDLITVPQPITPVTMENAEYGIEFFHIYTDEHIGDVHNASLQYLQAAKQAWHFNYKLVVLIDNYNPTEHVLTAGTVLDYLSANDASPDYWAYEGDMVINAQRLLDNLTSPKLQRNYTHYVEQHGKYPCSLLTATWYLTRLGALPSEGIISSVAADTDYTPVNRLINILPQDYRSVEKRARELVAKSIYADYADHIQDLFYPVSTGRTVSLW